MEFVSGGSRTIKYGDQLFPKRRNEPYEKFRHLEIELFTLFPDTTTGTTDLDGPRTSTYR